jgi:hypothetical protein
MSLPSRQRLWRFFEALCNQELQENSPKTEQLQWIKTPMLLHQQSAVAAALNLETAKTKGLEVGGIAGESVGGTLYTSYGILGDRVGSGKSLIALSLVKMDAPESKYMEYCHRGITTLGDGRDVGLLRMRDQTKTRALELTLRPVSTSLFIVPHALMGQWEQYVRNDTTLKCMFIKKKLDAASEALFAKIEEYDAVFVSSTMWTMYRTSNSVRSVLWKRVFIDEADSIAITTDYDDIHGLFYWFISASWMNLVFTGGAFLNITTGFQPPPNTPTSVITRIQKLVNNNYVTIPGCRHMNLVRRMCGISANHSSLGISAAVSQSARLIIRSSEEYIQASFAAPRPGGAFGSPIITSNYIVCTTPTNIRMLDSIISNDMMERLHAGDVAGALETLGMNSYTETEITGAVTASLQKELENAQKTLEFKKSIDYSSESQKAKAIEACENKIASINSRMTAIQDRLKQAKEQTCPICYSEVETPAVTPCCQQLFCFPCLCESLKRVAICPLCRERIDNVKDIKVLKDKTDTNTLQTDEPQTKSTRLNKNQSFIQFMKANPKARVLMFSAYDASFQGLEAAMDAANISHKTLNGSQARIAKLLREFKTAEDGVNGKVLFLNARNMGAGLNIESATHVVLFHRMAAELETQIIGRANRLGRTEPLNVVYLVHENEMVPQE